MLRRVSTIAVAIVLLFNIAPAAHARPWWKRQIDKAIGSADVGVMVADQGRVLYRHRARADKVPASTQKLLMSMALLDRLGAEATLATVAATDMFFGGVVHGDLWVLGSGDPAVSGGGAYDRSLDFDPTYTNDLAKAIVDAGVVSVQGSVAGSTTYFGRDWDAPGWKSYFPERYVPLPTALTFKNNTHKGRHITNPEWRFARSLTRRLEALGVPVVGRPKSGIAPEAVTPLATVESQPVRTLVTHMNHHSSNFFAEVLGKRLGVEHLGTPGTIAKGAAGTVTFASTNGVEMQAHDASGLSYANAISPKGMVRLLGHSEEQPWGEALMESLPSADEGTLKGRLEGTRLYAKTGTLSYVSTLSGWVWLRRTQSWAEFAVMSRGLYKSTATSIEDKIVRTVTKFGR